MAQGADAKASTSVGLSLLGRGGQNSSARTPMRQGHDSMRSSLAATDSTLHMLIKKQLQVSSGRRENLTKELEAVFKQSQ